MLRRYHVVRALALFVTASLLAVTVSRGQTTPPVTAPAESEPIASTPTPKLPAVENSVVKIFAMKRFPDVFRPWTKQPPQETTGSGVVIEGNRILTNAHVVAYASQVQI